MQILFQDNNPNPLMNFVRRFALPTLIVILAFIAFPLFLSRNFTPPLIYIIIISGIILIIYMAVLLYFYSKEYLYRLSTQEGNIVMEIINMRGEKRMVKVEILNKKLRVELNESLWSLNSRGRSTIFMSFIIANKTIYKQYGVGEWGNEELKNVLKELKSIGVEVRNNV